MDSVTLLDLATGRAAIHQYSIRKKAKSSRGQMTFDDLGGGRQMTFDDLGEGHWVTIGSGKGSDGNHGGHRVFIGNDGKMKTGKFAGQSMHEAFSENAEDEKKLAVRQPGEGGGEAGKDQLKPPSELPIPIRDRRAVADRLAAEGKAQAEIEEYLRARGVSISDAKRLSNQAGQVETKPAVPETNRPVTDAKSNNPETKPTKPETKPGISTEDRPNENAKPGDQMGLFGDVSNVPKPKAELPTGGETKGKQGALFDTKGAPDQMMMFDVGATPSDRLMPEAKSSESGTEPSGQTESIDKPTTPSEKASDLFSTDIAKGESPRAAATAAQKKLDEDYEFARASDVRNAGEDLKGSARHKVNRWKSLEDAETNGTAAELVTRDQLLKNEPHNLFVHADKNPLTALAMHYALKAFPPKPGTKGSSNAKKDREQYLEAYQSVKQKAEELAKTRDSADVVKAISEMQDHVAGLIKRFRLQKPGDSSNSGSDRYNQTANDLVNLHKALATNWRANKTGVAGRTNEFGQAAKERYGDLSVDNIVEHAKDIMEGKSLNVTFGRDKKQSKRFDPSEMYVKIATRTGGRDLSKVAGDANKATMHMVESMGLRGVQWGNSVTDDERKHHAAKAVEALTDLADTLGLHPKDIALDGKLGLAIGARGRGGAVAHYEPSTQVVNLTRKNGVGSLAHEWAHGFDHYLSGFKKGDFKDSPRMMSDRSKLTHSITSPEGRVTEVDQDTADRHLSIQSKYKVEALKDFGIRKAFQNLASEQSKYRDRLSSHLRAMVKEGWMTHEKAMEYWQSEREIFARTFERYVQHKLESAGKKNTYLAGIETKAHKAGGLWPTDQEVKAMAPAFDRLFEEFRKQKHGSADPVKYSMAEAVSAFMHCGSAREVAQWLIERYSHPFRQPTQAQREAGNYRKRHLRFHGLDISIETSKGQSRKPGWPKMPCDYGYFRGTLGRDGDHLDVFVGPNSASELVVIVDQVNAAKRFDEHKVLVGFSSKHEAVDCYRKAYSSGWQVGPVTTMTIDQFKCWLKEGSQKRQVSKQVSKYSHSASLNEVLA